MLRSAFMLSLAQRLGVTALLAATLAGGAAACGLSSDSALFNAGTTPTVEDDAGGGGALAPADTGLAPVDNAIVLVHAAKSEAYRLCFSNELTRQPLPDAETMPEANVVGVEVGSAVRLAPLKGAPGDVYLYDEPLIRAFYPQGGGPGPTCADLLKAGGMLASYAVKLGHISTDLSTGVHLLVVRGCPGNGPIETFSAAACGADWDATAGNRSITEIELQGTNRPKDGTLPAQIVNLSKQLDNQRAGRDLVVAFGDLTQQDALFTTVASAPPLFGGASPDVPTSLVFPSTDPAAYTSYGLRVGFADGDGGADAGASKVLDQPLDLIQAQSSPQDLPNKYYAAASNYAFLLLGDPNPTLIDGGPDPDDKQKLHMLAIPVIAPTADGGAEAGASDGGSGDADGGT